MNMAMGIEKMFGKIAPGMCRLSMNGNIAVKTSNGYKSYNVKTGKLTNCSQFVFDMGEDMFFMIPTNHVNIGDIILASGKPVCVIKAEKNAITALKYEDSTIVSIVPERHVFMGNTYFYSKIVSMFGNISGKDGKNNGMKQIMQYMMMSEMMKGSNGNNASIGTGMSNMLPLMMMNGSGMDMFSGMFDAMNFTMDDEEDDTDVDNNESEDNE